MKLFVVVVAVVLSVFVLGRAGGQSASRGCVGDGGASQLLHASITVVDEEMFQASEEIGVEELAQQPDAVNPEEEQPAPELEVVTIPAGAQPQGIGGGWTDCHSRLHLGGYEEGSLVLGFGKRWQQSKSLDTFGWT